MSFWITDSLRNFVTGLGIPGIDPTKSFKYDLCLLDRMTLENMYRGDWLARTICDAPAEDMTREWRSWQANQDQIEAIETVEKTLDIRRKVKNWVIKARLYGGGALVVGIDDGNDASQPVDLEKCGKGCLKYVVVLHRYELNAGPRIYNVTDPYYTRPAYYTVATPMFGFEGGPGLTAPQKPGVQEQVPGALQRAQPGFQSSNLLPFRFKSQLQTVPTNIGMTQIHPSRVLELAGNELPDWRLAPLGGGWGDSILQTVVDTMSSFTQTLQSISAVVSDAKLDVVKIPDLSTILNNNLYKNKLLERFMLSAQTKSVISALLLDKEEEWNRVQTNFGGLPMILHEFVTVVAAAAGIPVSRLFGEAQGRGMQGGSTAGGPDDLRNYYDICADQQKNEIGPRMGMLDQALMRSAIGKEDPNVHYEWNPLWQLSDQDKAAIAYQKAQTTQIYATIGILNEDAFREGVVNQLIEDGTYPGLDDAIEEFGAEPEEPEMPPMGGPPGGGGGPFAKALSGAGPGGKGGEAGEGSPNPEETGHSGTMGDSYDFNPSHDPKSGQFASGGGEGGKEGDYKSRVTGFLKSDRAQRILKSVGGELKEHGAELLGTAVGASLYHLTEINVPSELEHAIGHEIAHLGMRASIAGTMAYHLLNKVVDKLYGEVFPIDGATMDADADIKAGLRKLQRILKKMAPRYAKDFNPYHDPQGRFASGPGGEGGGETKEGGGKVAEGSPLSKEYSSESKLVGNTVHTGNVNDAVRALYEGRKVELSQPDQVSTLIHDLADRINKETAEKGDKAQHINLCNVSVAGTNLFCAETKGIPRIQMPQLDKEKNKEFRQYLQRNGYMVTKDKVLASHLRATQDELDPVKAQRTADKIEAKGEDKVMSRIFVSKDNYIVDGHHHWAGKLAHDAANGQLTDGTKVKVARVNVGIIPLLALADRFTGGAGHKGLADAGLADWEPEDEGIRPDEEIELGLHGHDDKE